MHAAAPSYVGLYGRLLDDPMISQPLPVADTKGPAGDNRWTDLAASQGHPTAQPAVEHEDAAAPGPVLKERADPQARLAAIKQRRRLAGGMTSAHRTFYPAQVDAGLCRVLLYILQIHPSMSQP